MSDLLGWLNAEDGLHPREVTAGGETRTVYFRRLTSGQREDVFKGSSISHVPGSANSVSIDLGQNEVQNQKIVLHTVCDENGTRLFKTLADVKKLGATRLTALSDAAWAANRDEDDLGKG